MLNSAWGRGAVIVAAVLGGLGLWDWLKPDPVIDVDADPVLTITNVSFSDLDGWSSDDVAAIIGPFQRSCGPLMQRDPESPMLRRPHPDHLPIGRLMGDTGEWAAICRLIDGASSNNIREIVEDAFVPVRISTEDTPELRAPGLFTGYFEPTYPATREPSAETAAPVLTRPDDLVMVDLGRFRDSLSGQRIAGRVENGRLVPYGDHQNLIETPPATSNSLGYLDPNDLLFLQIQGSGRLEFDDGAVARVGYAAQNGHPYVAVGRTLVREGHMEVKDVTMGSIRSWLSSAPPESAASVRYSNPSYVFFTPLDDLDDPGLGPLGAQGVQLTPMRSVAIDPGFYPYGAPVWINTEPSDGRPQIRQLFIAQDTGGAIRGAQRADLFFGNGNEAADAAGVMKDPGSIIVFVPKQSWERWQNAPR